MKPTKATSRDPHPRAQGVPNVPDVTSVPAAARSKRPTNGESPYAPEHDLLGMASTVDRLSTFASAVRTAGLADLLGSKGPFTIFAPTDRAFAKLPESVLNELLADQARLATLLCHHVVPGRVKAPKPQAPRMALPVSGAELSLTAAANAFHVEDARLVKTNIRATNGVIHAIDTVLMPR
ncbi:MAG TPA: fasciclin domain-containing protein [Gemmatimonadaceae bacterium]